MSFFAIERWGSSEDLPSEDRMRELLATLDVQDSEHPEVSLGHENGWTLSAYGSGLVVWENVENAGLNPRHMPGLRREEVLRLWLHLSRGELAAIELMPWQEGYGPAMSDEEKSRLQAEAATSMLASSRAFYDNLGPENPVKTCRHEGCTRGTVRFSVLCRPHHYESLYPSPCPFQH